MDVYDGCGKMEGSETANPGVPTAARYTMPYPSSRTPPEAHDGVVLLGPVTGATSVAANGVACGPDALVAALGSAVPPGTRNAVPYADWLAAHLSFGAHPAARAAVPYGDGLTAVLGSGAAPAPPNALAVYPDGLTAHLGSGAAPVPRTTTAYTDRLAVQLAPGATLAAPNGGAAYPDVAMENFASSMLTEQLGSGTSPGPGDGEPYPDKFMAHLGSGMSPAAWNTVAYPGELSSGTMAPDTSTVSYTIDVHEGVADFGFERLHPAGAEEGGGYCNSSAGITLPFAAQVVDDADRGGLAADAAVVEDEEVAAGAAAEGAGGGVGGLGFAATSLAVAGLLTAAGAAAPATAIALFATLLGGVTLIAVRVFRA